MAQTLNRGRRKHLLQVGGRLVEKPIILPPIPPISLGLFLVPVRRDPKSGQLQIYKITRPEEHESNVRLG
jgi:hypothetical protein